MTQKGAIKTLEDMLDEFLSKKRRRAIRYALRVLRYDGKMIGFLSVPNKILDKEE